MKKQKSTDTDKKREKKFRKAMAKIHKKYAATFRALAK